jgi:hypothetical protein
MAEDKPVNQPNVNEPKILKYSLGSTRRRSNSKGLATETQSNSKDRVFKSCRQIYENLLNYIYTGEVLLAKNAADGERSNSC